MFCTKVYKQRSNAEREMLQLSGTANVCNHLVCNWLLKGLGHAILGNFV